MEAGGRLIGWLERLITLGKLISVSSPAADAFSPDSVRRNGGLDGPVESGATGGPLDGAHPIEGP